jgi:hypothetical protein
VERIYQWLSERARSFRSRTSDRGTSRTIRTEVTVEQKGMTLVVGGGTELFDVCPLCGNKLAPEQAGASLPKASTAQAPTSVVHEGRGAKYLKTEAGGQEASGCSKSSRLTDRFSE